MSTMGVTDVLTKFGETEKIDSSSVSPVFDFSGGPVNHRLSPTIKKSRRWMLEVLGFVVSRFVLLCYLKSSKRARGIASKASLGRI